MTETCDICGKPGASLGIVVLCEQHWDGLAQITKAYNDRHLDLMYEYDAAQAALTVAEKQAKQDYISDEKAKAKTGK